MVTVRLGLLLGLLVITHRLAMTIAQVRFVVSERACEGLKERRFARRNRTDQQNPQPGAYLPIAVAHRLERDAMMQRARERAERSHRCRCMIAADDLGPRPDIILDQWR